MTITIQQQEPLKAIKMVKEQKNKEQEFATERIYIRCTPKQKAIYMNCGGTALVVKMLDKIAKELEEKKRKPLTSGKN